MNLLLDTHVFLWFLNDDSRLLAPVREIIENPKNHKWISMASCWEIAIKTGLKKLDLGEPAATFLPRELAANKFDMLNIELQHATFVETLPEFHKDPFDRLLIAQATLNQFSLVSADVIFDKYNMEHIW